MILRVDASIKWDHTFVLSLLFFPIFASFVRKKNVAFLSSLW